jgi:hypothetical protein
MGLRACPALRLSALVLASVFVLANPVRAEPQPSVTGDTFDQSLCAIIESSASANRLPVGFLTRLIWQESALRPNSVSPAGAQGIAQFMPRTAAERGLANPFDPETAIPEAARFLAELSNQFGNLGLAAAAYNAGPAQIAKWVAGQGDVPDETRGYVYSITARTVEEWARPSPIAPPSAAAPDANESCLKVIEAKRLTVAPETLALTPFAPWGVQLAGSFSKGLALASFQRTRQRYQAILGDVEPFVLASRLRSRGTRAFFRVRMPAATQAEAQRLCGRLHAVGGSCIVLRS